MNAQTAIFNMTENDPDAKTTLVKFLEETAINESREVKELVLPVIPNKTRLEITDFPHSPSSISSAPSSMSSSSMQLLSFIQICNNL
jgi:hypothetical protein